MAPKVRSSRLRQTSGNPLVPVEPPSVAQPLQVPVRASEEVCPPEDRLAALVVYEHVVVAVEFQAELFRRRVLRLRDVRGVTGVGYLEALPQRRVQLTVVAIDLHLVLQRTACVDDLAGIA